jgi:hypothetical protein
MINSLRSSDRSPKRIVLSCLPAVAVAMPVLAAPLGVTHTWDGSVNTSWHTAGNWNTNQVPAAGDSAIILGGPSNVALNADSADLATLFVGGGRLLSNSGHNLSVTNTLATTTVTGVDSTLFITSAAGPYGVETGSLTVQSNGRLQMSGGTAMINQELTLSSGGRITGNGSIYVHENAPAAFSAAGGSDITVSGGDLLLSVVGGGSIALAPTININNPNLTLHIDAPVFSPVGDINLGNGSAFDSEFNWMLDGTLTASPGSGNTSYIDGDGDMNVDGHISVGTNGRLRVLPQANFEPGSTTFIGLGATLELDGGYSVDAGHVTTIQPNAKLQLDGNPSIFGWDGDIVSNGGTIESNNALSLAIEGDLTLGSFGGLRTNINGASEVRAYGSVTVPGLGATVQGTFALAATGVMSLDQATTSLAVNGDLVLRSGSTSTGAGFIQVNADGDMRIQSGANVGVDVINGGDLDAGDNTLRNFIDIIGAFEQSANGWLNVDVGPGGGGAVSNDRYAIGDDAVLSGTLQVRLASGFTPEKGAEFVILTADSISGTFASLTGAPGFSVSYTNDEVILNYHGVGLYADVNDDGFVNVDDLIAVILAWGPCPPPPGECPADITLDGMVDVDDLIAVILHWNA